MNSSIVGSAISNYREIGSDDSGSGNPSADVGVNSEQNYSQSSLSPLQSGDLISFFYELDGSVSAGEVGISIASDVGGVIALRDAFYITLSGPYHQVFQTQSFAVDPSGMYDVYLGMDNSIVGTASSNFLDTLYLSEITVTDSSGNPVAGVTFTLGNDDVIPANQILPSPDAVPECAPPVMVLAGLVLVILKGRA